MYDGATRSSLLLVVRTQSLSHAQKQVKGSQHTQKQNLDTAAHVHAGGLSLSLYPTVPLIACLPLDLVPGTEPQAVSETVWFPSKASRGRFRRNDLLHLCAARFCNFLFGPSYRARLPHPPTHPHTHTPTHTQPPV